MSEEEILYVNTGELDLSSHLVQYLQAFTKAIQNHFQNNNIHINSKQTHSDTDRNISEGNVSVRQKE